MVLVPLENISEIHTSLFWYNNVLNVELAYLNGKQFLKFTHMNRFSNMREIVCIVSDAIQKIGYYTEDKKLKTQWEVLKAYKDGHLVGY